MTQRGSIGVVIPYAQQDSAVAGHMIPADQPVVALQMLTMMMGDDVTVRGQQSVSNMPVVRDREEAVASS